MVLLSEKLAQNIRLLILDVDGVLTDGGLYYDHKGNVTKRFHAQDGLGIKLAQDTGIEVAVITGLNHPAVEKRMYELNIQEYYAGHKNKVSILDGLCQSLNLVTSQIAFLGDDWVDAAIMRIVGLPMAVANAQPEILNLALWVSKHSGGHGAVREAIVFLLHAQGKLDKSWRKWSE